MIKIMAEFSIKKAFRELYESYDSGKVSKGNYSFFSLGHTSSYDKYFEDYTEYTEMDDYGHIHVTRVYEGDYYEAALSRNRRIAVKILYALFWLTAAAILILTGIRYSSIKLCVDVLMDGILRASAHN